MANVRFLRSTFIPSKNAVFNYNDILEVNNQTLIEELVSTDSVDVLEDTSKKKESTKKKNSPKVKEVAEEEIEEVAEQK